jgi:hypothetical protein
MREKVKVDLSLDYIVEDVMGDLSRLFKEAVFAFARGSKLRPEGRAPYLHILNWLAKSDEWSIDLGQEMNRHPENKQSISQVLEKGHLGALLHGDAARAALLGLIFILNRLQMF